MLTSTAVAIEPIVVPGERCRDWSQSSELEWLETNGTGGFAMGTVSGANTRRYHGLLVASLNPPVERSVLLSRVEEEVLVDGEHSNLGNAQYPGSISPAGYIPSPMRSTSATTLFPRTPMCASRRSAMRRGCRICTRSCRRRSPTGKMRGTRR